MIQKCMDYIPIRERLAAAESHLKVAEDTLRDDGWKLIERNCFGERIWVPPVRTSIYQKMFVDECHARAAADSERDKWREAHESTLFLLKSETKELVAAKKAVRNLKAKLSIINEGGSFNVIPMPIDAAGRGPASDADTVRTTWEVWNELNLSVASFDDESSAVMVCGILNKAESERDELRAEVERLRAALTPA